MQKIYCISKRQKFLKYLGSLNFQEKPPRVEFYSIRPPCVMSAPERCRYECICMNAWGRGDSGDV